MVPERRLRGVFWTRSAPRSGCSSCGLVLALVVLLGNLWLAGRLRRRRSPAGGTVRDLFDRLNEAAAGRARSGAPVAPGSGEPVRTTGARRRRLRAPTTCPTSSPLADWVARRSRRPLRRSVVAGSLAAALGDRPALAATACRSRRDGARVTDPIFGRDIGFFLFELPFLRLVQGAVQRAGHRGAAPRRSRATSSARSRGGARLHDAGPVHLAVLGGLFLLSVAFGYQLDKLELVYSTARASRTGVSFTDQNAQFFAYDVLTVVSGLAGGVPRRRRRSPACSGRSG